MFSFHRPKVYRSSTGCCICKAKSSSSRFTDSKRYEEDFLECFKLVTPRQGEICNACVLLVKRWKKLPVGSDRNWQHVVDARAGPGMKSFTKFKTKNKKPSSEKCVDKIKKKHFEREYSPALSDKSDVPEDMDIHDIDFLSEEGPRYVSMDSPRNGSPGASDYEEVVEQQDRSRRRKAKSRRRDQMQYSLSGFIDFDYWKKEIICCGTIFRGQNDEIMVDHSYIKPCLGRIAHCKAKALLAQTTPSAIREGVTTKGVFSDSSSDSGYDDCSNQGIAMSPDAQGGNHVVENGNPAAPMQDARVVEQRTVVINQGNRVAQQRMPVIEQGHRGGVVVNIQQETTRVITQRNLVSKQVADLMCHETMSFKPQKVREMHHLSPEMVVSDSMVVGRYHHAHQETATIRN